MIHDSAGRNKPLRCFRTLLFLAACFLAACGSAAAHDIPSDVTVHMFVKPAGERLQLLVRVPLKAMRDVDFPERDGAIWMSRSWLRCFRDAATLWIADFVAIYEGETRLPKPRVAATQVSLESDRSFASFEEALAHVTGPQALRAVATWSGTRCCSTCCSSTRSIRIAPRFSIRPGLERLAARVVTVLRFLPPGGAVRAYEFTGDPGMVPLDPRWHQAALALRRAGLLPYSRWHRPPAVSALPGDPVPALAPAASGGDRVHRGALDHADRVGLRPRARRALVSAADRNADRGLHRLHGAREHRRDAVRTAAG